MNIDPVIECTQSVGIALETYRPSTALDALIMQVVKHSLSMANLTGCDATEVLGVVYRETLCGIALSQSKGFVS